jgi:N-acetylmuramoyl-L-alanine amidase
MAVDYPGAIDMLLPTYYSFDSVNPVAIVQHSTGGDLTLDAVHNTFLQTKRSTHFAVDRDGNVAQFVPLSRGAGGNCCPDGSHDVFWNQYIPQYPNLNLCTLSIEHCNDGSQSLVMTPAQMDASNRLTLWLCQKFGIPSSHIKGHDSIDATNCPGVAFYNTYWQSMINYVNSGGGNVHMQQQFNDVWYSNGVVPPGYQSGIYKSVLAGFIAQKYSACCPLEKELATVDWGGNQIQWQPLSNGLHAEYGADGVTRVYDCFNNLVWSK